jgi:transglutaminase-like putative cysteine protease
MTVNGRMTIIAGVACVLVSTVLYPVFQGSGWFYAGIGAVIAVGAAGALSRLRTLPVLVCLAISVLGLLLYLNLLFEARHSWIGFIPTPGSISSLWRLAGTGFSDSRKYAPAVPEFAGLVLLATAGIGLTAIMTDLIAVRLRSTALAGLPLLVLFTVPVAINAPHSQLSTGIIFCLGTAGYLAMLSTDGRERIRVWGRLISLWRTGWLHESTTYNVSAYNGSRSGGSAGSGGSVSSVSSVGSGSGAGRGGAKGSRGGSGAGPDTRALAAAGRRVGLASVVLALCAPLLLPGLHPSKLFASGPGIGGTGGTGSGAVGLPNALLQIATQLQEKKPTQVLTYTTTATQNVQTYDPQYLREASYDTLTDAGWMPDYSAGAAQLGTLPWPTGLQLGLVLPQVTTKVNVDADVPNPALTFLPMPYPAVQASVAAPGLWLTDPELMVFSDGGAIAGQSYQVTSVVVDPSPADLRAAPAPPAASLTADLTLPKSYQLAALKQLAEKITAGKKTEYDKVNALALYLANNGNYSTATRPFTTAAGMVAFLKTKTGSCVQFAWTMAVLARLIGIPARLASGFTAGMPAKQPDHYVVKTNDSHAWTEVYFQNYGWLRFEPTPGGQGTAVAPNYMGDTAGKGGFGILPNLPGSGSTGTAHNGDTSRTHLVQGRSGDGGPVILPGTTGTASSTPWTAIVLAVLAAIALACGIIALAAPPAQRMLSSHAAEAPRRRRPVTLAATLVALAAIVAIALYRVLSRTSGLDPRVGWATVGIVFGVACAVALVLPGTARVALRRWRWMRAADDVSRAHAAWREFRDDLADLGVGGRPSEPPRTLANRVTAGLPEPAAAAIRRLALAEERARYAARPAESQTLRRDGVTARRGIAAAARRGARWRALIFPTSLMTAIADAAARLTERITALRSRRAEHGSAG